MYLENQSRILDGLSFGKASDLNVDPSINGFTTLVTMFEKQNCEGVLLDAPMADKTGQSAL